jgi:hypothetical protein
MFETRQSAYEQMQSFMNRLVLAGLAVAAFAVILVFLLG